MKNITTIERIAMQKTAMQKTAMEKTSIEKITAKITTTALLFFLALFTLTTNLKAQAVQDNSKSGFFAGFVVLDGFQVDSTKSITTSETTSYRVTGYEDDETTRIEVTLSENITDTALRAGLTALFSANCETGATSINSNGEYSFTLDYFRSFDPGQKPTSEQIADNDATVTLNSTANPFPTGYTPGETSHCFTHFSSSARTSFVFSDYSVSGDSQEQVAAASSSTESDKLSGIGLQFGYRGEKWRASFTHYTGQGGDNELTNSLVMADYFFSGEFFVGAGIASMQLTNSSAGSSISASATSPVLQVGYTENLTKNLQLSIGVLQYSSGLSLSHSSTPAPGDSFSETQTAIGDSVTIGALIYTSEAGSQARQAQYTPEFSVDARTEVTQVGERTVNIEEIITPAGGGTVEAELKAPTVISISLQLASNQISHPCKGRYLPFH